MSPAITPTRRVRVGLGIGLVVLIVLSLHRLYWAPPSGLYVAFSGKSMGTTWDVKVANPEMDPDSMRRTAAAIDEALEEVVSLMSTWEPDSEISRFNASRSTQPFAISPPTVEVLEIAEVVSERSGGAFDITIGPLVEAWGFGSREEDRKPPSKSQLKTLRRRVGYGLLELDSAAGKLRKADPALEVDLSAIAKGYGVDRVTGALEKLGHLAYLVEVGGELRGRGRRLDGTPWRVAIERPAEEIRTIHQVLELKNRAMATSGDYRNYYELEGQRISHTLDPRTGHPIDHPLASVSVLHEEATWADAWATALNVLGPETGYNLAESEGLAAYFIIRKAPEEFESRATSSFEALLGEP